MYILIWFRLSLLLVSNLNLHISGFLTAFKFLFCNCDWSNTVKVENFWSHYSKLLCWHLIHSFSCHASSRDVIFGVCLLSLPHIFFKIVHVVTLWTSFALSCSCLVMVSNSLLCSVALMSTFCALWNFTLLVQDITWSLVILLVFLTAVNYLMICLHHCLCHWWNVSLVFCLLLYICIHLPSFWDSPSILQHSYLAFLLACIIARIILSLCVVH